MVLTALWNVGLLAYFFRCIRVRLAPVDMDGHEEDMTPDSERQTTREVPAASRARLCAAQIQGTWQAPTTEEDFVQKMNDAALKTASTAFSDKIQ